MSVEVEWGRFFLLSFLLPLVALRGSMRREENKACLDGHTFYATKLPTRFLVSNACKYIGSPEDVIFLYSGIQQEAQFPRVCRRDSQHIVQTAIRWVCACVRVSFRA